MSQHDPLERALNELEQENPDVAAAAQALRDTIDRLPYEPIVIRAPEGINQTTVQRLCDLIRCGGIEWHRRNNPEWRDNPYKDGIVVDLDEDDVLRALAAYILQHEDTKTGGTD